MAFDSIHNLYAILCNTTPIGGILDQRAFTNAELRGEPSDGAIFPPVSHLVSQNPGGQIKSRNLKDVIDILDASHMYYTFAGAGFSLFGQKHAEGATRASGSAHRKITAAKGMLIPRRLGASHGQDATIDIDAVVGWNGSANPWAITDSASLPTAPDDTGRWTIGPCSFGNVTVDGLKSIEIEWNPTPRVESADSDIWPRSISLATSMPRIMVRGINVKIWLESGGIPLEGLPAEHNNTVITFRKYNGEGGSYIADNVAEHIAITCSGIIVPQDLIGGSSGNAQECSFEVKARHDGTNNPLVINTTAVIS